MQAQVFTDSQRRDRAPSRRPSARRRWAARRRRCTSGNGRRRRSTASSAPCTATTSTRRSTSIATASAAPAQKTGRLMCDAARVDVGGVREDRRSRQRPDPALARLRRERARDDGVRHEHARRERSAIGDPEILEPERPADRRRRLIARQHMRLRTVLLSAAAAAVFGSALTAQNPDGTRARPAAAGPAEPPRTRSAEVGWRLAPAEQKYAAIDGARLERDTSASRPRCRADIATTGIRSTGDASSARRRTPRTPSG